MRVYITMSSTLDQNTDAAISNAATVNGQLKRSAEDGNESTRTKKKKQRHEDLPRSAPIYLFASQSDIAARRTAGRDKEHWSKTQCLTLREMLGEPINVVFFSSNSDLHSTLPSHYKVPICC